ncbi:NACHT domain-containing protein [Nitrospira sp. Nam80]
MSQDLRSYGSEDRLVKDLFHSQSFAEWRNSGESLQLFLDSLDECLMRIDTLSALLLNELRKCPVDRLFLRIACRTAEWPNSLESGLNELWGDKQVAAYEIAPLRKKDVEEAARENGLDVQQFVHEVEKTGIVPFATKPVTLEFLVKQSRRQGRLAFTQAELYEQGCRFLCEEPSDNRRETKLKPVYSVDQRMAVAARVAAVTSFSNRYAVWTGREQENVTDDDVAILELCGGKETAREEAFKVNEESITEAIGTGLFSSRGPYRMGWAHQTYAEFLAARYLMDKQLPFDQLKMLLIHSGDPQGKIIPQLQEVAAWLAEMSAAVFDHIIQTEPDLLLRSPVATAHVENRSKLVKALLVSCEKEIFHPRDVATAFRYKKLAHPALSGELRPYLVDKSKNPLARYLAIEIAEGCEQRDLQKELLAIALDQEQMTDIRKNAAYAIKKIGDESTNNALLPLALGEAGDDPDDELKGCGLRAVWPGGISAERLFTCLTAPKRDSFIGAYRAFLYYELAEGLKPADLLPALKWVAKLQRQEGELRREFERAVGQIMRAAWEQMEVPGVAEAFGLAAFSRLKHYEEVFAGRFGNLSETIVMSDDVKRQKVVDALLPHLTSPQLDVACLTATGDSLVQGRDFYWMMERLRSENDQHIQRVIARLIHFIFDRSKQNHFDAVYSTAQIVPILAEEFVWLLKPTILRSPEAEEMKNLYRHREEILRRRPERAVLEPAPAEQVRKMLDEFELGHSSAWWRLNRELTLTPTSTHDGDELEPDITALPGWAAADMETRKRIVSAAKKYIEIEDPRTTHWLGTNTFYRPAFAGYRALMLLVIMDLDFTSTIAAESWRKWAPVILAYPSSALGEKEHIHLGLVKMAYISCPETVIQTLLLLIDVQNRDHGDVFVIRKMDECWDGRLCSALAAKLTDHNLKPRCVAQLLKDLIGRGIPEARLFAEGLLTPPIASSGELREKSLAAMRVLLTEAKDAGWPVIWPILQQDPVFGKEAVSSIDSYSNKNGTWSTLEEVKLADLYIWLARQFPHSTDPERGGAHWVGPNERARNLRDAVLNTLKLKGTFRACEAIRRIRSELPELDWLKWVQADAELQARRDSWNPPQPEHLLAIFRNSQSRIIQSGDHLLQVIKESLNRLAAKLHGETPSVQFLWIPTKPGNIRPRDESAFSDFVKLHLDEDLKSKQIIVNREVQIHIKEKTDIHIDTFVRCRDSELVNRISVIIEVKGSWHRELQNAMRTQLTEQYLRNNYCQHGLYLVGWFNCDEWDEKDYRKRDAPKLTLDEAKEKFAAQAVALSRDGIHIEAFVLDTSFD